MLFLVAGLGQILAHPRTVGYVTVLNSTYRDYSCLQITLLAWLQSLVVGGSPAGRLQPPHLPVTLSPASRINCWAWDGQG